MRRALWELALLVSGLALWIVLVDQTTLTSVNHPGAWFTCGYPFVWKIGASASPLYVYLPALLEDIGFWLVLSLAFVELPVRFALVYLYRRFNRSGGPALPSQGRQLIRASIIIASAIVIAALLISASTFAAIWGPVTTTLTLTTTFTSTSTSVSTSTMTTTVTYTSATTFTTTVLVPSSNSSLSSDCSHAQTPSSSGEMFGEVTVAKTSPALICVQFYYFDTAAAMTLNLTSAFAINAQSPGRSFEGSGNFTVVPSQMQLVVGGPNGENEGAVVAYAVTARAGASGTYELFSFSSDGYYLGSEPLECGFYGELVAGNGQPEYTNPGGFNGCLTYSMSNASGSPTIQGVQYPLMTGSLYFRVVGVINSTQ